MCRHARQQLARSERLHEVVIGVGLQSYQTRLLGALILPAKTS
jgi:hypothetical protein